MPRRRALIIQADIARVIRAAMQAGAAEVEVKVGNHIMIVRFTPSTGPLPSLVPDEEVIL